jgi:hypothetical protein
MSVDHITDAHPGFVSRRQIGGDVADRVHDGRGGVTSASEDVRRTDGVVVQELAQDHESLHVWPASFGQLECALIEDSIIILIDIILA